MSETLASSAIRPDYPEPLWVQTVELVNAEIERGTLRPGMRLPHMWLQDGTALQDRLGDGYTLLRTGRGPSVDTTALEQAMRRSLAGERVTTGREGPRG